MVVVDGKIRGKDRPRFNTKTGRAFSTKDNITYENWIKICYKDQDNRFLEGAIKANIIAYYEIPKSYSKKRIRGILEGKELPQKKPDGDNICKVVLDSLNSVAYKDDSAIVEITILKRYTEGKERIEFELQEI